MGQQKRTISFRVFRVFKIWARAARRVCNLRIEASPQNLQLGNHAALGRTAGRRETGIKMQKGSFDNAERYLKMLTNVYNTDKNIQKWLLTAHSNVQNRHELSTMPRNSLEQDARMAKKNSKWFASYGNIKPKCPKMGYDNSQQ